MILRQKYQNYFVFYFSFTIIINNQQFNSSYRFKTYYHTSNTYYHNDHEISLEFHFTMIEHFTVQKIQSVQIIYLINFHNSFSSQDQINNKLSQLQFLLIYFHYHSLTSKRRFGKVLPTPLKSCTIGHLCNLFEVENMSLM